MQAYLHRNRALRFLLVQDARWNGRGAMPTRSPDAVGAIPTSDVDPLETELSARFELAVPDDLALNIQRTASRERLS